MELISNTTEIPAKIHLILSNCTKNASTPLLTPKITKIRAGKQQSVEKMAVKTAEIARMRDFFTPALAKCSYR